MPRIKHSPPTCEAVAADPRLELLIKWLNSQAYSDFSLEPASEDASFRRYFRMTRLNQESLIIMDAPPQKESLSPFVEIAQDWKTGHIVVPEIYASSRELGFLILEDFGSSTMLSALNAENLVSTYSKAIDELIGLQIHKPQHHLPAYTENLLRSEMQLFVDWFLIKHCEYELSSNEEYELQALFDLLSISALEQQQVTVHRDYHSRNLMFRSQLQPGVIDFQDAVHGPISYDLVSLLKDCYVKLDDLQRSELLAYYLNSAKGKILEQTQYARFKQDFDWMGVQRHLKAIGIFARLYHRDTKPNYLQDIPRTASYILDLAEHYPQLKTLITILNRVLPELDTRVRNS